MSKHTQVGEYDYQIIVISIFNNLSCIVYTQHIYDIVYSNSIIIWYYIMINIFRYLQTTCRNFNSLMLNTIFKSR